MTNTASEIRLRLTQSLPIGEAATLTGLDVTSPLILDGLDLSSFDLSRTIFHQFVSMRGARLNGLSWFKNCIFKGGVDFSNTIFSNDARFDQALFKQGLTITQAEIYGASDFSHCQFWGKINFDHSIFFGNLSLASVLCDAQISMREAQCLGGLWASGANFFQSIDTSGLDVHGRLWLRDIQQLGNNNSIEALANRINNYGYQWL